MHKPTSFLHGLLLLAMQIFNGAPMAKKFVAGIVRGFKGGRTRKNGDGVAGQ